MGTSTGGILALGLAMPDGSRPRHTAERLLGLNVSEAQTIFPGGGPQTSTQRVFGTRDPVLRRASGVRAAVRGRGSGQVLRRGRVLRRRPEDDDRRLAGPARARPAGASVLVIGAGHASFIDWPMLPLWRVAMARRGLGTPAPGVVWRVASDYLLDFFGEHLCGRTGSLLAGEGSDDRVRIDPPRALFA